MRPIIQHSIIIILSISFFYRLLSSFIYLHRIPLEISSPPTPTYPHIRACSPVFDSAQTDQLHLYHYYHLGDTCTD